MNHPMNSQIEEYADGSLTPEMARELASHIAVCPSCRAKEVSFRVLERSLRGLPLTEPGAGFTERVIWRLGLPEGGSFLWKLLANLAPLMALILIAGVLYGVINLVGSLGGPRIDSSLDSITTVYRGVGDTFSDGMDAVRSFTARYLPFIADHRSGGMILFLVLLFTGVALVDRYLLMPLMTRRKVGGVS
jgi:hypothetical protein